MGSKPDSDQRSIISDPDAKQARRLRVPRVLGSSQRNGTALCTDHH